MKKQGKSYIKPLEEISELKGDIRKLEGYKNRYRYKINHYRITFDWIKGRKL